MALLFGDPAPPLVAEGLSNPRYVLDTAAGRYLLLAFVRGPDVDAAVERIGRRRGAFNDLHASAFVVVVGEDPDRSARRDALPGLRFLFDAGGAAAARYEIGEAGRWFLLDPALHVMADVGPDQAPALIERVAALPPPARHGRCSGPAPGLVERIAALPPPARHGGFSGTAPVLVTPRIFEAGFCERLIELYQEVGGQPSGFMREVDGVTTLMMNDQHKRRSDVIIED